MDIDRRKLLAGSACLALTGLFGPAVTYCPVDAAECHEAARWHPLTRLLLDRARRANAIDPRANAASIERLIRDVAGAQGCANPPVIKWLANPFEAHAYLSRLGLDELLRMNSAWLWRRAGPIVDLDEDRLNSAAVLGGEISDAVRASECDSVLMLPKLLSKARVMADNASVEAIFEVRAVAAQIGWLETCIPVVAALAVTEVELLLSAGVSEETIRQQLNVFEAYELGLLATWETPDAVVCVPRVWRPQSSATDSSIPG